MYPCRREDASDDYPRPVARVRRRRMRNPRWAVLTAAVFMILVAEVARAQVIAGRFRIDAQVVQSKKGTPVYSGYIYNDGGGGVGNIRLLVEALDAEGKVIGEGEGAALGNMVAPRSSLLRSASADHGCELSSARAVVGYLRHWAMMFQGLGAATPLFRLMVIDCHRR